MQVLSVKTANGTIVLENVPQNAEILVDGEKTAFTWPGHGKPLEIRAVPGRRLVEVKADGFETQGEFVTVKIGESAPMRVHLDPPPEKPEIADELAEAGKKKSQTNDPGKDQPLRDPVASDKDRRAAEMVLRRGGIAVIRVSEVEAEINPSNGLPAAPLRLVRARLRNRPDLVDADLEAFRGLADLVEVTLPDCKIITDAGIAHLRSLASLRHVDLWNTQATNEGLRYLESLVQLEFLNLGGTRVTGAGLADLHGLTNLRYLNLWWDNITDADLAHLKGFSRLESLDLSGTPVTDRGIVHLKGLTRLRHLSLYRSHATGAWLADPQALAQVTQLSLRGLAMNANLTHLPNLPQLESVDLGLSVTDAGLAHLDGLTQLKFLKLDKARLTDQGLVHLRGLTQLKEVNLRGTAVTAMGVGALQKGLSRVPDYRRSRRAG